MNKMFDQISKWHSASNRPLQCDTAFAADATMTAAMFDRLLDHAHVAMNSGESYRLAIAVRRGSLCQQQNPRSAQLTLGLSSVLRGTVKT